MIGLDLQLFGGRGGSSGGNGGGTSAISAANANVRISGGASSINKPNPEKYSNIADRNRSKAAGGDTYYKDLVNEYDAFASAAKSINLNSNTFSGTKAVIAMDNAKVGSSVTVSGAGYRDGTYTLTRVPATSYRNGGDVWVSDSGKTSFGNGASNLANELGMIRGGEFANNPNVKVKFNKK